MSRRGRRRILDAEERALWDHVVRSVKRLRPEKPAGAPSIVAAPEPLPVVEPPPEPKAKTKAKSGTPPKVAAAPASPPPPPLAALEPKTRRRLTRGAEVDARLDLHGLTQAAAHRRLRLFLMEAQASGHALVLVITGKGDPERLMSSGPAFGEGRGVLKRAVPLWLAEPDLRAVVVGFESAGRRHGGEGALYVRIRRRR
ncbi:Smr/MutS family protein [Xanthobacter sp.]|uniref:Smr/MutS family protein n=1 Tax=Xanthobacter sp. TaxID=35809 RepID=UPI0025EDBF41|nr:Smr/MutS family protein [Xanthobacter sp.]